VAAMHGRVQYPESIRYAEQPSGFHNVGEYSSTINRGDRMA